MTKTALLFLIVLTLAACSIPTYVFDKESQTTGINFTTGKWLLNAVDAPDNVVELLTKRVRADFEEVLGTRLSYVPETKGLLLPQKKMELNPSKLTLSNLQKGTKHDYFITIKAAQLKNNYEPLLGNRRNNGDGENVNDVTVEIYDLNTQQIVYTQRAIGSTGRAGANGVQLAKPSSALILGAYKKIMKDLLKKSVH